MSSVVYLLFVYSLNYREALHITTVSHICMQKEKSTFNAVATLLIITTFIKNGLLSSYNIRITCKFSRNTTKLLASYSDYTE